MPARVKFGIAGFLQVGCPSCTQTSSFKALNLAGEVYFFSPSMYFCVCLFLWKAFAGCYAECNPDMVRQFRRADTVFLLAFAIVMLNTDLHNKNIKPDRKMKLDDFIRNLRGTSLWHAVHRDEHSPFLGWLLWVDLIKWVSNICPGVHPFAVYKKFFWFQWNWRVGWGRWVMHDSIQYDLIQGQGHEPLKVGNLSTFKRYLLCHLQWELATDHWFLNYGTVSKFGQARFLIFVLVLYHVALNVPETSVAKSRLSVPYRANFLSVVIPASLSHVTTIVISTKMTGSVPSNFKNSVIFFLSFDVNPTHVSVVAMELMCACACVWSVDGRQVLMVVRT